MATTVELKLPINLTSPGAKVSASRIVITPHESLSGFVQCVPPKANDDEDVVGEGT